MTWTIETATAQLHRYQSLVQNAPRGAHITLTVNGVEFMRLLTAYVEALRKIEELKKGGLDP